MKVLVFPRDANPYQELLYAPMRKQGVTVAYLDGPTGSHTLNILFLPLQLIYNRLRGFDVLHVHWTFPFALLWAGTPGRFVMQGWSGLCWTLARLFGYRLLWTAHNALPHERLFWNDVRAHRLLGNLAHTIIVHTDGARQQLQDIGVTNRRIVYVPHGSYIGVYPDDVDQRAARRELGLGNDRTVILFFGHIRPYKGVESLLAAWRNMPAGHNLTLVVAGAPHDEQLARRLRRASDRDSSIHVALKHIADKELQYYFRAADFAVLPYEKATTSGVALLACSFGLPLITPDLPAFGGLPPGMRIVYAPGDLTGALIAAAGMPGGKITKLAAAAQRYAAALSWTRIAGRTAAIFRGQP